jgi:hypothetical protein
MWHNLIGALLRGGPLEIPRGGGYKIFAARFFFQSRVSAGFFFNACNLCKNFFQDYLHFAVCLREFFFQAFFFARIVLGEFSPPPLPGFLMVRPLISTSHPLAAGPFDF